MRACIIISFLITSLVIVLITIPYVFYPQKVEARCPNGYHKSPSGDCEQVVSHEGKLPRCPNGFHLVLTEIVRESLIIMVMMATITMRSVSDIPSKNDKDTTSNTFSSSSGTTASIPPSPSVVTASESTPGKCDDSLWNHVYNPSRLQIVDKCITVTGIIDSIRSEQDGDLHIRLNVDPPMRI